MPVLRVAPDRLFTLGNKVGSPREIILGAIDSIATCNASMADHIAIVKEKADVSDTAKLKL